MDKKTRRILEEEEAEASRLQEERLHPVNHKLQEIIETNLNLVASGAISRDQASLLIVTDALISGAISFFPRQPKPSKISYSAKITQNHLSCNDHYLRLEITAGKTTYYFNYTARQSVRVSTEIQDLLRKNFQLGSAFKKGKDVTISAGYSEQIIKNILSLCLKSV